MGGSSLAVEGRSPAARREALDAVSGYAAAMQPADWDEGAVAGSSILMYHQARRGSCRPTLCMHAVLHMQQLLTEPPCPTRLTCLASAP